MTVYSANIIFNLQIYNLSLQIENLQNDHVKLNYLQINNLQKLLAWKKKRKNMRLTFKLKFVEKTAKKYRGLSI